MNEQQIRFDGREGLFTSPPALAQLVGFRMGSVYVEPAFRRLTTCDRRTIVTEPLVMQVLVMLAEQQGRQGEAIALWKQIFGRYFPST